MTFFDNLQARISRLDKKTWYQYLAITAAVFFLIVGLILFFYYSSVSRWQQKIEEINEMRQEAKSVLNKAVRVQKDRAQVMALLEEDPNFKIREYMQGLFERVGISLQDNISLQTSVSTTTTQDGYREDLATYQLVGITMRQLTELLNEIEENKRVYIKDLEISKSKKVPHTIDVDIKVATMMPKEAT